MIQQTEIKFHLSQGWGDYKSLVLIKYELGKAFNGYLEKGNIEWQEMREGNNDDINGNPLIYFMKIPRWLDVQQIVDALTNMKKATEQIETLSELKATRYHLEDMRKLVFKKDENSTDSQ